jgi:hypothetical protein
MLHRREAIQCHIRMFVIIKPLPPRGIALQFVQRGKQLLLQPVIMHCPVVSLNISILLRFAGLTDLTWHRYWEGIKNRNAQKCEELKQVCLQYQYCLCGGPFVIASLVTVWRAQPSTMTSSMISLSQTSLVIKGRG